MAPFTLNLAAPSARLVTADDVSKLSFVTGSWLHLNTFINIVESLPADFKGGSEAEAKALNALRQEAGVFGSPKALRQLLVQRPNALTMTDGPPLSPALHPNRVAGAASAFVGGIRQFIPSESGTAGGVEPEL